MIAHAWAPPLAAAAAAALLRLAGERAHRPVPGFAAGAAGLIAGWSLIQPLVLAPPNLAVTAAVAALVAALAIRSTPARAPRGRTPPPAPTRPAETTAWIAVLALSGGWWLAGGGTHPLPIVPAATGAAAIAIACLLARDPWAIAAAALCLWATLHALGVALPLAAPALVVVAATLGAGPALPLAAGLGAVSATVLTHATTRLAHGVPIGLAAIAPLACLLLLHLWRHRFARFGRAATPTRAGVAAALTCLIAYSAAAMTGLR